jgi:hypothetical protein
MDVHALGRVRNLDKVSKFSATSLETLVQMVDSSYREIALAWRKGSVRAEEFRHLGGLMKKYR